MSTESGGLTKQAANDVYDVLVRECRASDGDRDNFVHHQTAAHVTEWRFSGALGFGGKFWRTSGRRPDGTWGELWIVNNYSEDLTPERSAMISTTNAALEALRFDHPDYRQEWKP